MPYSRNEIVELLNSEGREKEELFLRADIVRRRHLGEGIFLRGLIEYSNVCSKNCLYCGIRADAACDRYTLSDEEVLEAAEFAYENGYGSVVIQGGENRNPVHIEKITELVGKIAEIAGDNPGITLSLGEQSLETYKNWKEAGASRYLLRIETSSDGLYKKIHPADDRHDFNLRLRALRDLRDAGYQVGTGVMVGLPFQAVADLADDILFMVDTDIDMCGMGPYIMSAGTPLAVYSDTLRSPGWRVEMTLKMIAVLRIMMPDINIAASTALQTLDPGSRVAALECGANIIMPNITPDIYREKYFLYDNKPKVLDSRILEKNIKYFETGDSRRFAKRSPKDI